jgi:hypothetical protein
VKLLCRGGDCVGTSGAAPPCLGYMAHGDMVGFYFTSYRLSQHLSCAFVFRLELLQFHADQVSGQGLTAASRNIRPASYSFSLHLAKKLGVVI